MNNGTINLKTGDLVYYCSVGTKRCSPTKIESVAERYVTAHSGPTDPLTPQRFSRQTGQSLGRTSSFLSSTIPAGYTVLGVSQ